MFRNVLQWIGAEIDAKDVISFFHNAFKDMKPILIESVGLGVPKNVFGNPFPLYARYICQYRRIFYPGIQYGSRQRTYTDVLRIFAKQT